MIRRITLVNFMAHRETVIEPGRGLTVLAGPNNCGKSAVVEALQVLNGNTGKDFMVRHGTNECRVIVETVEGDRIEWRRVKGVVSYEINGREINRVRGDVPEELHGLLKLSPVEGPDGKDFSVHFGLQKSPIFLLDQSGKHTATFFASSSDASRLLEMQAAHKRKVMDRRAEEKVCVRREEALAGSVAALEPVGELMERLDELEKEFASLTAEVEAIERAEVAVRKMRAVEGIAAGAEAELVVLGKLAGPPMMEETMELARCMGRIGMLERMKVFETARGAVMRGLMGPPVPEETRGLEVLCAQISRHVEEVARQTDVAGSMELIAPPVELPDLVPMAQVVTCINLAQANVSEATAALARVEEQLQELAAEIERWAAGHPVCPTCGGVVDAQVVMEGVHSHA